MKVRILFATAILALGLSGSARGQVIAVFADSLGTQNCIEVPEVPIVHLYVLFVPGGDIDAVQGVEFTSVGLPQEWSIISSSANPAAEFTGGNPFDNSQERNECAMAFEECQSGVVMLWKALVLAHPEMENQSMRIEPRIHCPGFPCFGPIVYRCDDPVYTAVVMPTSETMINPTSGCEVAIESRNWTAVKQLYRP